MAERTPQDQEKFVLRLPDGMRDRIKAAAEANGRSMNAEIVATLFQKYPEPMVALAAPLGKMLFEYVLEGGDAAGMATRLNDVNAMLVNRGSRIDLTIDADGTKHFEFTVTVPDKLAETGPK